MAAEYELTVDAQIAKDPGFTDLFGLTDSVIPVQYTFTIDDSVTPFVTVPAGTDILGGGGSFTTDAHLIRSGSISGLSITIGNESWSKANLSNGAMGAHGQFEIALIGNLADGAVTKVLMGASKSSGSFHTGSFLCGGSTCNTLTGVAEDFLTGSFGEVVNAQATVTSLSQTPQEQITDLADQVMSLNNENDIPNFDNYSNSLEVKLQNALSALDDVKKGNTNSAVAKLEAFINEVNAQRGNKIADAEADALIAAAQAVIDSL
jgi:hypothetical protein